MPVAVITIEGISYSYGGIEVLSDVSFSMQRGDYIGLVGPNGSGKSTLIRLILGLVSPARGSIRIFGLPNTGFRGRGSIGYVPQKVNFFNPHFPSTVAEVVGLGLVNDSRRKTAGGSTAQAVEHALDLVGISHLRKTLIGDLSGGQQQRAFIARALVSTPELLILDEPPTALAPEPRDNFFNLLHQLNHANRVSIILVTHDIGSIGAFASKLLYLDKKVVFYGSFDEFCLSAHMTSVFGPSSQHIICHKHG